MLARMHMIGHLGRDPEVKTVGDKIVATFSVAHTRKRKGNESTLWFDVEAWGKLGDICGQYLKKGSLVYVEGDVREDVWEDKTTGQKRSKLRIEATDMKMLSKKDEAPF